MGFFFLINRKGQTCLMYIHYKWIFLLVFQRAQGSLDEKLDSKVLHTGGDHLFFHTAFTTQRHWMLKKSSYVEKKPVFFIPFHILLLKIYFPIVEIKFNKWKITLQVSSLQVETGNRIIKLLEISFSDCGSG